MKRYSIRNIGIVSYWFNRGQGTVGRYIRSICDDLGYMTFVLARPTKTRFIKPGFVANSDVWDQNGVTQASQFDIPTDEYISWVKDNNIQVAFFDQNYQFEAIRELRKLGVVTIGRFVWETFSTAHVADAKMSYDIIYSLTKCEKLRYHQFGIQSPILRWGIHPELLAYREQKKFKKITFFYPGGYLSPRKPLGVLLEALSLVKSHDIKLIIKVQKEHQVRDIAIAKRMEHTFKSRIRNDDPVLLQRDKIFNDPRICLITEDMRTESYYSLFSSCHVCLAPSRWEGLGLHLYEALAFGMPIITNDNPPMNEVVQDKHNGILIKSHSIGMTKSGIQAFEPDIDDLAMAIESLAKPENITALGSGACDSSRQLSWQQTISDYDNLLQNVASTNSIGRRI